MNRFVLFGVIITLGLLPAGATAAEIITDSPGEQSPQQIKTERGQESISNLVLISNQGRWGASNSGNLEIVDRTTDRVVYEHDEFRRYMDVDQVNETTLFFVAGVPTDSGFERRAVLLDWTSDSVLATYPVPADTHDVDWLGDGKIAVADKANHRGYIRNVSSNTTTWDFDYADEYTAADGGDRSGDWTHLNDIDVVQNGSAVLLSPRNFNRIMLVDRQNDSVIWTVGEQNDTSIIRRQHNPSLIDTDPLTVLIADSRNHRIVEFQQRNGSWVETWVYNTSLAWPRDSDRLPNGNTAITDTNNNRVLIVTPNGSTAWEYRTSSKHPYDIELLAYEDEPQGPTIGEATADEAESTGIATRLRRIEAVAAWVGVFPRQFSLLDVTGVTVSLLTALAATVSAGLSRLRR
jgi:hypothetical protein